MAVEQERGEYVSWCWETEIKIEREKCIDYNDTWVCIVYEIYGV